MILPSGEPLFIFLDKLPGIFCSFKNIAWGAWVAQLVKRPTLAQVMISQIVGLSPASGSVLIAQSLEPALDSVSPPLSAPPMLMLCLCLSGINKHEKYFFKKDFM